MHVTFVIDNLGSGGAQRQAVEVAVRLRRDAGVRVRFGVYRRVDFFRPRLEEAGIAVEMLPKRGPVDPAFPGRLRAWLAADPPDVVHVFLPGPTLWVALARRGAPDGTVWIAAERCSPDDLTGAWPFMLRRALRAYDAVTANSHPAAEGLVTRLGVPAERVHYLPNGIDLEAWDRRAAEPAPFDLEPGRFHVGVVGRISEQKNQLQLLQVLGELGPAEREDLRVWLVGAEDGPPRLLEGIRREIARHGLGEAVRMLPPTPGLPALMARLDALVLPSRFEGFPNVVLEAMASRLPILATTVGDVPFMLEDGRSAWLVPAEDGAALRAGLARLRAMSPDARAAMGAAARATVEARYGIEAVARQHLALYRRLADGLRGDAPRRALG